LAIETIKLAYNPKLYHARQATLHTSWYSHAGSYPKP